MLGLEQRLHQYEPLFGGWYLRGEIGSGSYGRVYRVENQNLFGVTYTAALKAIEILPDDKDLLDAPEHLRSAAYEEAMSEVETLAQLRGEQVNMFTTVFIGNSQTREIDRKMVTPRGYTL